MISRYRDDTSAMRRRLEYLLITDGRAALPRVSRSGLSLASRIIPAESPVRSYNFQAMDRWALKIVDVDSTHRAMREFQSYFRDIFDINFKRGKMSVE